MDRQQIGLKLTLDALSIPPRLDRFSDRLLLQKAIYLSQAGGVQLGYHFNWYLRGPYSPTLTRDAFAVVAELSQGTNDSEAWNLDQNSLARLSKLQKLCQTVGATDLPIKLELLASVHFLLQTPAHRDKDIASLQAVLQRYGKDFSQESIRQAIEELKEYGLRPTNSSA